MACCLTFASAEEREAIRRSIEIDQCLEREKMGLPKQTKILLLGPNESGKSSFWNLLRIIYGPKAYSKEEQLQLTSAIYCTILDGMRETILCMKGFQIPFQYPENEQKCSVLKNWRHKKCVTDVEFSPYVEPLMSLWKDKGVQEAVKRADLYTLGYIPSIADVFRRQNLTIGINELVVTVGKTKTYKFISYGGSRSSQRKWLHMFDDVNCVVFFVAANEFDQILPDNDMTNRLVDSIKQFEEISCSPLFRDVPVILILDKSDLLSEKIKQKDIRNYFPHFEGDPHNLDDVQKFLIQMFDTVRYDRTTQALPCYFMTATDADAVRVVFNMIRDVIFASLFRGYDLM